MGLRKRSDDGEIEPTERERLADELAEIRAEIKALRRERDSEGEAAKLRRDIEELKMSKDRMQEDNKRAIRETEHKTGLLRERTEQDIEHARRETELKVREENLSAERERFERDMAFQREHLQGEVDRVGKVLEQILERLPVIEVSLDGPAATRKPAAGPARKDG